MVYYCKRTHVTLCGFFVLLSLCIPIITIYTPRYQEVKSQWQWSSVFWRIVETNLVTEANTTYMEYVWRPVYPVDPTYPGNDYHVQDCCHEYAIAWSLT